MWLGLDDVPFYKFQGDKKAHQYILSDVMNVLDEWPSIFPCRIYKFWGGKQDIHALDIEIKTWGYITNIQYSTNTLIHKLQFTYGGIDLVRTQGFAFFLLLPQTVIKSWPDPPSP